MARSITLDSDGDLRWMEKVVDPDGDDVTHPLSSTVELHKIDNQPVSGPSRNPSWLESTINELGENAEGEWEETVEVIIRDAQSNLSQGVYQFLLRASDGIDESDRLVNLSIP